MLYLVAIVMFIAALVMLQISRNKSAAGQTKDSAATRTASARYASVKLCCDRHACSSAQSMRNQAVLAKDAPALPLAACDAIHCQCKYAKTSDRRAMGGRRAMDLGIQPLIFDGTENRSDDRRT